MSFRESPLAGGCIERQRKEKGKRRKNNKIVAPCEEVVMRGEDLRMNEVRYDYETLSQIGGDCKARVVGGEIKWQQFHWETIKKHNNCEL